MTDKISKALAKLSAQERKQVRSLLEAIQTGKLKGFELKKLKGHTGIFRIRKGSLRIIYKKTNKNVQVLAIERRSEKTYRDF